MANNYEGMFQDRYMKALSMFTDAASRGEDPRIILAQMQREQGGDPTFSEATNTGALPQQGLGPKMVGPGVISDVEIENVEKYTPEQRMQMDLGKPLSEITEQERRGWMAMDSENNMPITMEEIQSDTSPRARPIGSGSLTEEEIKALSNRLAPKMIPQGVGSISEMEYKQYMQDALDAAGGGGINALGSTAEGLLLNLGRKLTGE